MPVFVTELNGIMAVIVYEDSLAAAKSRAKAELATCGWYPRLEIDGKPFWDGKTESIKTRRADPYETALFFKSFVGSIEEPDFCGDGTMNDAYDYNVFPAPVVVNEDRPIVWRH